MLVVVGEYCMGVWLKRAKNIARIASITLKGIKMTNDEFKQQVCLALLQNLEWMPKFNDVEDMAKYSGTRVRWAALSSNGRDRGVVSIL